MLPLKVFDVNAYLNVANQLLCADETLMALKFLDMVPGYYRRNYPKELADLKRQVMAKIATSCFYATHVGCEVEVGEEACLSYAQTLRAQLIIADVKRLNGINIKPHIIDMGGGENWLPVVLRDLDFSYESAFVNWPTYEKTKYRFEKFVAKRTPDQPVIFFACELLEHIHRHDEIRFEMERRCGKADVVIISTPKETFNPNVTDWTKIGDLGHLMTFTSNEFSDILSRIFFDYAGTFYDSQILGARFISPETKFEVLKTHYEIKEP